MNRATTTRCRVLLTGVSFLAAACAAAPALAQEPLAGQQPETGQAPLHQTGQLEDIVVTARYQSENLQDTPLAITALPGAALEARAITDVATLGAVVPNLYTHPGDAVQGPTPTISMRGVTAGDYSFARDPAVGVYVDDVYHSTLVGSNLDLTDVDRIEVKRGPQGTLAGNASIAGTISIFSKVPKGDGSGFFSAGYGSFDELEFKGAYDAALADNLFLRVSGQSRRQDGYVDQLDFTCEMQRQGTPQLAGSFPVRDRSASQRDCKIGEFGGTNLSAGKAVLRYVASDRLELTAQVAYSKLTGDAPAELLVDPHPAPNDGFGSVYSKRLFDRYGVVYDKRFLPPPGRPYSAYATFDRPLEGIAFDNSQGQHSTDASGRIDYDLTDEIHLKAIGAFSDYGGHLHQAGDVSPLGYVQGQVFFKTTQYTGELRLNGSMFDGALDWVAGLYYFKSKNNLTGDIDFITINFTEDDDFTTNSESAFAHVDYDLTERLSISAGARYTHYKKTAQLDHPPLFSETEKFLVKQGRFDWLLSAQYKFTDDLMLYATAATGSRPAGVSTIVNTVYQLSQYPAETLTAYELGFKSELFDRHLRLNVAGFYSDYPSRLTSQSGFQCLGEAPPPKRRLLASECPPGGAIGWSITIGTPAKIYGFEFEATAEPVDDLLINFSGGYNHFDNGVTTPGRPGYIVKGNLPQPEWNLNGGVQYGFDIGPGKLTPRLDWVYTSRQTFNFTQSATAPGPFDVVPSQSIYNAQVEYDLGDSGWSATLKVTNLFDKYYFYTLFEGSNVATAGVVAPPREWRLTLRKQF